MAKQASCQKRGSRRPRPSRPSARRRSRLHAPASPSRGREPAAPSRRRRAAGGGVPATMGGVSTPACPALPSADRPDVAARLREALLAAAFTADGLLDLLGAPAYAALARSETVPALRATRGDTPLETLVRLFLLQQPVAARAGAGALPLDDVPRATAGWCRDGRRTVTRATRGRPAVRRARGPGLVHRRPTWAARSAAPAASGGAATRGRRPRRRRRLHDARRHHRAYARRLRPRPRHRLRHPGAARRPARHPRDGDRPQPARPALRPAHPRAVRRARRPICARARSSSRSGRRDVRPDRLQPAVRDLAGRPADLPGRRDGRRRSVPHARSAGGRPAERRAGTRQFLANWQHVEGEEWQERLRSWVPRGCDAWIVQREVQDVTQYAELWLRDARRPPRRTRPSTRRGTTPGWTSSRRARPKAVGFGWITLRKSRRRAARRSSSRSGRTPSSSRSARRCGRTSSRQDYLRAHDDAALLAGHFRLADGGRAGAGRAARRRGPRARGAASAPRHAAGHQGGHGRRGLRGGVRRVAAARGGFWTPSPSCVGEDPVLLRDRTPAGDPAAGGAGLPAAGGHGSVAPAAPADAEAEGPLGAGPAVHLPFVLASTCGVRVRAMHSGMESGPALFAGVTLALFGAGLLVWTRCGCVRTSRSRTGVPPVAEPRRPFFSA